jgi:hypothetical protein
MGTKPQVRKMELLTPEDRWLDPEDESDFIEVYKKGTEQECQDFINNIDGSGLKTQFKIIRC